MSTRIIASDLLDDLDREWIQKVIRKEGSKWVLYSHDGSKVLGKHDTREEAEAQERAVQASKHAIHKSDRERVLKDADGLAARFQDEAHPFTACMNAPDLVERYPDEEQRKQVCGAMKAAIPEADVAT